MNKRNARWKYPLFHHMNGAGQEVLKNNIRGFTWQIDYAVWRK